MDHPVRNGDGVELRLVDCDISEDELFRGSRHPLDVAPALPAVRYLELWNRLVFWLQFEEGGRPGGQFNSFVEISTDFSTEFL